MERNSFILEPQIQQLPLEKLPLLTSQSMQQHGGEIAVRASIATPNHQPIHTEPAVEVTPDTATGETNA